MLVVWYISMQKPNPILSAPYQTEKRPLIKRQERNETKERRG
jgi:hypothetical protein